MGLFPNECPYCTREDNLDFEDQCVAEVAEKQPYLTDEEKELFSGTRVVLDCEYTGYGYATSEKWPSYVFVEEQYAAEMTDEVRSRVVATLICESCSRKHFRPAKEDVLSSASQPLAIGPQKPAQLPVASAVIPQAGTILPPKSPARPAQSILPPARASILPPKSPARAASPLRVPLPLPASPTRQVIRASSPPRSVLPSSPRKGTVLPPRVDTILPPKSASRSILRMLPQAPLRATSPPRAYLALPASPRRALLTAPTSPLLPLPALPAVALPTLPAFAATLPALPALAAPRAGVLPLPIARGPGSPGRSLLKGPTVGVVPPTPGKGIRWKPEEELRMIHPITPIKNMIFAPSPPELGAKPQRFGGSILPPRSYSTPTVITLR